MATEQKIRQVNTEKAARQRIMEIYLRLTNDDRTNPMREVLELTGELIAIWLKFPNAVHAHVMADLIHSNAETMHQAVLDLEDLGHLSNNFDCYLDRPEQIAERESGIRTTGLARLND